MRKLVENSKKFDRHKYTKFYGISGKLIVPKEHSDALENLIKLQCSAKRSIYQFLRANPDKPDQIYKQVRPLYSDLPSRYFNAVVALAKQLPLDERVIFGGKYNWKRLNNGEISKKAWLEGRNNTLYSQALSTGNELLQVKKFPNEQVILRIKLPRITSKANWLELPIKCSRFNELPANTGYSVRLTRAKGRKFKVDITWGVSMQKAKPNKGCIAIDVNPTVIAWVELNGAGNLLRSGEVVLERITSAKGHKRSNDIILGAREVIKIAKLANKPIVIEKLNFGTGANRGKRKFNRMLHNFCYRAILNQIDRQAAKVGLPVKQVIPAYTSVLGIAKYADMYKLNRHNAAAMVIGRRGLGFKERINFPVEIRMSKKEKLAQRCKPDSGRNMVCAAIKKPVQVRITEASYKRMTTHWCRHSGRAYSPSRAEARNKDGSNAVGLVLPSCNDLSRSKSNRTKACASGEAKSSLSRPRFTKLIIGSRNPKSHCPNTSVIFA